MDRIIDWTKYPGLPETPAVPEWRDTPEREAFWREFQALPDFCDRKSGCLLLLALDVLLTVAISVILAPMEKAEFHISDLLVSFPAIALEMMIPAMLLWFLISRVVLLWRTLRLARRHGFLMLRLKRPNVSGEIQEILDARPAFDKQAFRALWPSEQHAQCAERLLEIASEYWRLPGKMLYPNDPLLFFYFGKYFPWWWNRMLLEPPGDFWDDLLQEFKVTEEIAKLDKGSTLAEMVECLLGER